ncbi:MAG TPA: hypothetical protein VGN72_06395 [Tepidisphaeraceae bacterium]|jgi:hypothetical protein|nr:hypothetical protein [Tepidisphaeraceae bacterium]
MVWNKASIIQTLRKLHKQGVDLSYNRLAKRQQAIVSASAYHFGSYRRAVEKAGLDYAEIIRRPRWTRQAIITQIKKGKRDGHDLNWSSITKRRDELGKAAFASLQPRLFGSWDRALHAAGLDADEVNRYRKWDKNTIVFELKARGRDGQALNSGALQTEDPGLHAAAVRHFGDYDKALRGAKVDPDAVRRRRTWTKAEVTAALRSMKRAGTHVSDSVVRTENSALYGACVRLFGSFTSARDAAGVKVVKKTAKRVVKAPAKRPKSEPKRARKSKR